MEEYMVHPDAVMMSTFYDGMIRKRYHGVQKKTVSTKTMMVSHVHKSMTPKIMLICRLRSCRLNIFSGKAGNIYVETLTYCRYGE